MKKFLMELTIGFIFVLCMIICLSLLVILGLSFISMSLSPVVWAVDNFNWVGFRGLIVVSLFLGTLLAIPR